MRGWEVVATMTADGRTWVVPASEGRRTRRTKLAALRLARRLTRQDASRVLYGPPFVWIVRRPVRSTK